MDIITRNFFRLLRAGVFGQQDKVEPLSACKWRKTFHLAKLHSVEAEAFEGVEVLGNQFFMRLPDELHKEWADSAAAARLREKPGQDIANERLTKKLATIAEQADNHSADYRLTRELSLLAYALLTDDHWVRQLLTLGEQVRECGSQANPNQLSKWIGKMGLSQMVHLEGTMLVDLMGVMPDELPFDMPRNTTHLKRLAETIAATVPQGEKQWQFSQGNNIFVRTNNASAVVWSARRSARFFRYYPTESVVHFLTSFAHSLTNIEE